MASLNRDVAKTYTVEDFINMQTTDNMTFRNYSLVAVINGIELTDQNVVEDFLDTLTDDIIKVDLSYNEYIRYKYAPDLLAYDVYGSVQLDFMILYLNGIIDPKDFDFKTVKLVRASVLKDFMNRVYDSQKYILANNKYEYGVHNSVT